MFSRKPPTIYYAAPDYSAPSWGIGLLYRHVEMLRRGGFDAWIVHNRAPFRLDWLESDAPVTYLDDPTFKPRQSDILVVPEVDAGRRSLRGIRCRRIVFVQGSFLILSRLDEAVSYRALGYEQAITILPHVQQIVEEHFGVKASIIPPFVALYFFLNPADVQSRPRRRRIVLYPKPGSPDYDILSKMLHSRLRERRSPAQWELVELKDMAHREVAHTMQEAAFFVNVNCREAFNTTVPEAMAAGCIPVCYEAYGGRDFLRDGQNAFVFPNNHIYPLLEKLLSLVRHYDKLQEQLGQMRAQAYATARLYTEENTERALLAFYRGMLG